MSEESCEKAAEKLYKRADEKFAIADDFKDKALKIDFDLQLEWQASGMRSVEQVIADKYAERQRRWEEVGARDEDRDLC